MKTDYQKFADKHTATYSPEDNKIRLYFAYRIDKDDWNRLKAAGFTWTMKQESDMVATWKPSREDIALEFCGGIGDHDLDGLLDRSADRAERFAGYRDRREADAEGYKERAGDVDAVGMQSEAKANARANKIERLRNHTAINWEKAEYWQQRTARVIAHALHKSSATVRRGRILTLEAELRRYEKHPQHYARSIDHLKMRLLYENQMLEHEGGLASAVEMEKGGRLAGYLIHKVNKSPVTGRVVSVVVMAPSGRFEYAWQAERNHGEHLQKVNIERAGEDIYTPPTPEDLALFEKQNNKRKAKVQAANAAAPKLINPTLADAQRLQDILNAKEGKRSKYFKPSEVLEITQEIYTRNSKGDYSPCETVFLTEKYNLKSGRYCRPTLQTDVCKIRVGEGASLHSARRVIVITDKPQKPLPWDRIAEIEAAHPSIEDLIPRLDELRDIISKDWLEKRTEAEKELFNAALYRGLVFQSSMSQYGFTDKGQELYQAQKAEAANV